MVFGTHLAPSHICSSPGSIINALPGDNPALSGGPLVIECLWHCWLAQASSRWRYNGLSLDTYMLGNVREKDSAQEGPWLSHRDSLLSGCICFYGCKFSSQSRISKFVIMWETLDLVKRGSGFLQSRLARLLHHERDALESYRFFAGFLSFYCVLHVWNHFHPLPTRLIFAISSHFLDCGSGRMMFSLFIFYKSSQLISTAFPFKTTYHLIHP